MAKIESTLLDNSENFKLVDKIKQLIKQEEVNHILIATGYWDIPGTAIIAEELDRFLSQDRKTVKLLIGKDPTVFESQLSELNIKDIKHTKDLIKIKLEQLEAKQEYTKAVELLKKYCNGENPKLCIHTFENPQDKNQFFHSKCYIFAQNIFEKDKNDHGLYAIVGSSNFTQKGFEDNSELNYLEIQSQVIDAHNNNFQKGHIQWFKEKWALSVDWTKEFLLALNNSSVGKLGSENTNEVNLNTSNLTPYENYIKLLQDKFGMITDTEFKNILESYLPSKYMPLEYQLNAVQQCYAFMLQHGGFALGDVVGLGKTVVGILLVKYYIETSQKLGKSDKVLIIVPPAIKSAWEATVKDFDENQTDKISEHIKYLTTGSLNHLYEDFTNEEVENAEENFSDGEYDDFELSSEEQKKVVKNLDADLKNFTAEKENYGLIIIDESHKFRNSTTEMYVALKEYLTLVKTREGYYPFIGLLSATMQNNSPRDIQNQIYLFEHEPKNSTFEKVEGRNLEHFFSTVCAKYKTIMNERKKMLGIEQASFTDNENSKKELIALSQEIREKVLSDILVRRTRTDIKKHYNDELKFPKVHGPLNLNYKMDNRLAKLFYDTMNIIAPKEKDGELFTDEGLGYYRYRATMFLNDEYQKVYSGRNMNATRSSNQLARIMQILLVKRLESSFEAFKESLRNFERYTENMIKMWENDCIFICPQIDVNKELNIKEKQAKFSDKEITLETCFNDIRKKIEKLNSEGKNSKKQNAEYRQSDFTEKNKKSYIDLLKQDLKKIKDLVQRWNEETEDPKLDRFKEALNPNNNELFSKKKNIPQKLVIFSEAISTVNSLCRVVENKTGKKPLLITAENRDKMENVIKENFDANYPKDKQKNDFDVIITTEVLAEGINLHRANTILNYDTPWNATRLIQRIGRVNRIGSENSDIYVYNFYPSAEGDEQISLVQNAYTKLQSFHTMFGEDAKIFSTDEELSEGNFEAVIDGEESPQEKYIAELKEYKNKNKERYEFIESLEKAEDKCIESVFADEKGNSYLAIKIANNFGCVYVKVDKDLHGQVISYMQMFDACKCSENAVALKATQNIEVIKEAALTEFHKYESRLTKSKKPSKKVTETLLKAHNFINGKKLTKELMSLIATAVEHIKNGNTALCDRLNKVLQELDKPSLFEQMQEEEVIQIIKRELGNIAKENNKKHGDAYIFAGFYL